MEDCIQISKLNDFIFCPRSLYFHRLFENFNEQTYHDVPQTRGKIAHEKIEKGQYSSLKKYLQALEVYSDELNICGKIDIFDKEKGALIERKYRIKKIYDGYVFQLYAQALCLVEMGYAVKKLFFHSLADNKRYQVAFPDLKVEAALKKLIMDMRAYDIVKDKTPYNANKCDHCIYRTLCH